MKRSFYSVIIIYLFILASSKLMAQGDGPRSWWPAVNKTNVFSGIYLNLGNSNQVANTNLFGAGADFNTNMYGLSYTRAFKVNNKPLGVMAIVLGGSVEGDINGSFLGQNTTSSIDVSGLADIQLIGIYGLIGQPNVNSFQDLMQPNKYGFTLSTLVGVTVPSGEYDDDRLVNIGANRWAFRFGLPMAKFLNWGKPHVTSFELTPNVIFYTPNNSFIGNNELEQKALLTLEGHITQGINRMLWVSADAFYQVGGETAVNGVDSDDNITGFAPGATLGAYFSESLNVKFSYGGLLTSDDNIEGNMFRVFLTYNLFPKTKS